MTQNETDMQEVAGTKAERVAEQTRIRLGLLKNGYAPLANKNKTCLLPGWPGLKITKTLISDTWADQLRYCATGVRVDGRLVVLDFDIDDDDMLDAVYDALPDDLVDRICAAPTRKGKGAKVAVFMRLADGEGAFGRIVSQAYAPPGSDQTCRLEVFGSGEARQFGAFGPHSHDDDGAVAVSYRWVDGLSLLDVPLGELPEITRAEVLEVCDAASWAMREGGWEYEVKSKSGVVESSVAFTLDDDMEFETRDYGVLGLGELEDLCSVVGEGVRLSAGWLEGSVAVNTSRCIARLNDGDGRVQIWESADCRLYRPAALNVHSVVGRLSERLGRSAAAAAVEKVSGGSKGSEDDEVSEAGAEAGGAAAPVDRWSALVAAAKAKGSVFSKTKPESGGSGEAEKTDADGSQAFESAVESLVQSWAWVAVGGGFAAPVGGTADQMLTLGGLKNTMAPWCAKVKKGRQVVEMNPVDTWIKHPERMMVAGHRLLPWSTESVAADESGQMWLNTYQPPAHLGAELDETAAAEAESVWLRFLQHLVPDARERTWFEMWLAAKVQRPWLPNCGVVMVAETHGTGRGTLFDILGSVMGERHVKPVSSTELMGGSGQGQYTDWLADALLVTCDELLAGNDAGGAMEWKRREVYERLKTYVDPRTRRVRIVRKSLPGYETDVFASFLLATNNPNALPLAEQDRRFAVLRNTEDKLMDVDGGRLLDDMSAYRDATSRFSQRLGAAIWRRLKNIEVVWGDLRDAPTWMEGRADMLAANESDLEELVGNVMSAVPGDFILGEHLRARLKIAVAANGLEGEVKNWWTRAQDLLARRNGSGWRRMARRQDTQPRNAGRKFVAVYYRVEGAGEKTWGETPLEKRPELWKRGSDLNDKISRLETQIRERGMKVVE